LVKLAVHTIGLVNEDESGLVDLFPDFPERMGVAGELGLEFVKTALFSLLLKDFPDEVQCCIGLFFEFFYLHFERNNSLSVPGLFNVEAPNTKGEQNDSGRGNTES